jgi:hypothetical protein
MYKEELGLLPIRSHKLIDNITSDHIKQLPQYEELNRNKNKYFGGISAVIIYKYLLVIKKTFIEYHIFMAESTYLKCQVITCMKSFKQLT